jgi:riboflavin kinase/FMN adenylyltransferase
MQIIEQIADARLDRPSLVTVGTYDGIHIGHQRVLGQLVAAARSSNHTAVVITFQPRPQAVLAPHRPAYDLVTPAEKLALLDDLGVDVAVVLRFTPALAAVSAADFVGQLVHGLYMRELWLGVGAALGRNREGDIPTLTRLGDSLGYRVRVVEPVVCDGDVVSSTRIRSHLLAGQIRAATALLGRYPSLIGEVVHGTRRGHKLGFPTANIGVPPNLVIPPNGVYACFACVDDQRRPAVTNIGVRPTFTEQERTIEAHLLDFDADLYGRTLRLELVEFQRPEMRFDGIAALIAQISADVARARTLLSAEQARPACPLAALRVPGLALACDPESGTAGEP